MILQIVQSLYRGIGVIDGIAPGGDAQTHLGPKPNASLRSYRVRGRGRGRVLHMNAAAPSQDQTITIHGGSSIQGVPLQPLSQSYDQPHLGPRPSVSGRPYRVRGRGKRRALHKHAAAPAQDQKIFIQGRSDIQGGPSQPMRQSGASSFGQILVPFQGPAHSASVVPPPKLVCCELCRVECNTLEILKQHMNGKKHKKKLKVFEELQNLNKRVICRQMEQTSTSELKSEAPSQPDQVEGSGNQQLQQEILHSREINEESKVAVEKRKVEDVEPTEESVKKVRMDNSEGLGCGFKRKVRGGKGSRRVRSCDRSKRLVEPPKPKEVIPLVCELCNVKCESPVVFQSHLVGKKHQSKSKRFLSHQETLGQELLQALDQQNANASTSIGSQLHDQGFGAYQCASAQNVKIIDVQPESLPANFGASIQVNAEGTSKEGHLETQLQGDCPTGSLVATKMVGAAAGSVPVTSGTTLDGGSLLAQSVVVSSSALVALPGPDTIMEGTKYSE